MSYFIEVKPAVTEYLLDTDRVPPAVAAVVLGGLTTELANDADKFATRRALAPESY